MVTSPSTCCVLGATGFIGGHVARAALARGWSVRALRRRPEATGAIGDLEVDWVLGDLYDPPSLVEAMAGCRVVFHSAGYYPTRRSSVRAAVEHAVAGVRNVLDAASEAGVDRLVYTGVFTTVGPPDDPARMANEGDAYTPGSVPNRYYESKWAMEREILGAAPAGLETIALLPTAVLGPGDVKPTTGGLLLAAGRGLLLGYVDAVTNIIDVRDVAAAHIAAAEQGRPGERYIVGGHNVTVRAGLTVAARAAGRRPPILRLPTCLAVAVGRLGGFLGTSGTDHLAAIRSWHAVDSTKARQGLGLAEPIPLAQTCSDTLDWFQQHGYL